MPKIKVAFVLAAGRGERLRPLTDKTPKPLLPVHGRPILDFILDRLESFGIEHVVLNAWHLADQVEGFAERRSTKSSLKIQVSREEELLGTGGGLKRAWPLINEFPFLMMNGDCFWSGDLKGFVDRSLTSHHENSWAMVPAQKKQTEIGVKQGQVIKIGTQWSTGEEPEASGCFSGLQLFQSLAVDDLPEKGCVIRDYLLHRLKRGLRIRADFEVFTEWTDIGTPESYQALNARALASP